MFSQERCGDLLLIPVRVVEVLLVGRYSEEVRCSVIQDDATTASVRLHGLDLVGTSIHEIKSVFCYRGITF